MHKIEKGLSRIISKKSSSFKLSVNLVRNHQQTLFPQNLQENNYKRKQNTDSKNNFSLHKKDWIILKPLNLNYQYALFFSCFSRKIIIIFLSPYFARTEEAGDNSGRDAMIKIQGRSKRGIRGSREGSGTGIEFFPRK